MALIPLQRHKTGSDERKKLGDGEYITDNNEVKNISVRNISRDIRNWIRELQDITTEGDSNKWNKAIFNLNAQGKFNMEFIWDQELHD
ncbi:immunity protein YezG family protein [Sphingobacterium athyrii]|uniref:Uncharacterized protein n=1 Tax=Sphingobacterium athyrii TaxID=2152717 RepID=A0A363NTB9_9SPHI|nr:immunity protein YezG family protein [Sphingobacterium athyrii]PUV24056.1 hypothetical protein DCO56_11835 [Sphingobacterium athyrii]